MSVNVELGITTILDLSSNNMKHQDRLLYAA